MVRNRRRGHYKFTEKTNSRKAFVSLGMAAVSILVYVIFVLLSFNEAGQLSTYYGSAGIEQEISEIQMLTDNQGQAFREQVLAFMEQQTGIQSIQNMIGLSAQWEEREIEGSQLTEKMENELLQI